MDPFRFLRVVLLFPPAGPRQGGEQSIVRGRNRSRRKVGVFAERLEIRQMLAADPIVLPANWATPLASTVTPTGLSPSQVRDAYGVNNISFANGAVVGDGAGQTIAIIVAYDNPYIASDLQIFSQTYGLPAASLQVIKQTPSIRVNGGWGLESSLDVQWAHAIAPRANILLFEAKSDSLSDLMTMVNVARQQPSVSVISMSWGLSEFSGQLNYDSILTTPLGHQGISFVAASGDNGARQGATYPSISPNVLSVGGTQLFVTPSGTYLYETGWSDSGGGSSRYYSEPAYQRSAQGTGLRTSPDVAWNASVSSGFSVFSTLSDSGPGGWFSVGGTSAGAPAWGALIALANQGRAVYGQGTLAGTQSLVYAMPNTNFHDIISGRNGYNAGFGYDLVTGLGTPCADRVVDNLVFATVTNPIGNFVVATASRRSRRLNRSRVRPNSELDEAATLGTVLTTGSDGGRSSSANASTNIVEITTLSPNQVLVVLVVAGRGRLLEAVVVQAPSLDITQITTSETGSSKISKPLPLDTTTNAERIGQADDRETPNETPLVAADDSIVPSIQDLLDLRPARSNKHFGPFDLDGVPPRLIPQDAPGEESDPRTSLAIDDESDVPTFLRERDSESSIAGSIDDTDLDWFTALNSGFEGDERVAWPVTDTDPKIDAKANESTDTGAIAAASIVIGGAWFSRIRPEFAHRSFEVSGEGFGCALDRPRSHRSRKFQRGGATDPLRLFRQRPRG